ncbi:MAG: CapA family protein [Myxococcota bacterium]|nr:CapA family protein [Myxococcota bacterium]
MRRLLILSGALVAAAVAIVLGWYCFWTYLNPAVHVPDPAVVTITGPDIRAGARILFLGDTGPVDRAKKIVEKRGYTFPYAKTRSLLQDYDAVVVNLEAPITTSTTPSFLRPARYRYKASPAAAAALKEVGITAVSLANNHAKDYLSRGLADTLAHLEQNGISHFGAGMTEGDARRGIVLKTGTGHIGLIGYMEDQRHWRVKNLSFALDVAGFSWPGVARLVESDVAEDIARMRKQCDTVIVVVHWGKNYEPVTDAQKRLGALLIDLGADAVVGHHSHQAQPVGVYKNRPIIYSLGNYAFDTPGRKTMRYGLGAGFHFEGGQIRNVEIIPLLTQNRQINFQPRIPSGPLLDVFFETLIPASKEHGAIIKRDNNRGWLVRTNR